MGIRRQKLGLLVSQGPGHPRFRHALGLAGAALARDLEVYLYLIDDGVRGAADPALQEYRGQGMRLFVCAYGAQKRDLPRNDNALFAGLTMVSDLMAGTDRFLCL